MSEQRTELEELEMIRKLLILGLVKLGLTQDELGAALGMHRTTIARMFPTGFLKEVGKKG
jgi:DNA-binding XRE family transcriptional regulator